MNFDQIKDIIVRTAKEKGISEYDLYFYAEESVGTEALKSEISSFSSGNGMSLGFRLIANGKMGRASTELFTEEEIAGLVDRAMANASCITSDDEEIIFPGSPSYRPAENKPIAKPDTALMKETTLALQKLAFEQSDKVSDGTQCAAYAFTIDTHLYNSYGLDLSDRYGAQYAYASVDVKDGEDAASGFEVKEGMTMDELADLPVMAAETALSKLGADLVETGKYPIIICGKQMRGLLSTFSSVFSSKNAQQGLSLLAGKEGEVIAADCITIVDDPFRPGAVQASFDGEGAATYTKNVVEKGKLNTLLYNLSTAKKAGKETTGNGTRSNGIRFYNFYLAGGELTDQELLQKAEGGIYITELKGMHAGANPTTGDFSLESAGFMIQNGKLGKPVKSFTITGNFFSLLKQIELLGKEVKFGVPTSTTVFGAPDTFIPEMDVAGK